MNSNPVITQITYWPVPGVATLHLEGFSANKVTRPLSSSVRGLTPPLQHRMLLCPPHKGECEGHTGAALLMPRAPEGPAMPAIIFRLMVTSSFACKRDTGAKWGFSSFLSVPGVFIRPVIETSCFSPNGVIRSVSGYLRLSLIRETWGHVKSFESVCKVYLDDAPKWKSGNTGANWAAPHLKRGFFFFLK